MLWRRLACPLLSLAALLVVASCGGAEQKRGTDGATGSSVGKGGSGSGSSSSGSGGSSSSSSTAGGREGGNGRRLHRVQHGQCTYTFILPEGEGGPGGSACRESKAGTAYNANALQRDAPPPEPDFSSQKIQQLEHVMENYTQWLQKVRHTYRTSAMECMDPICASPDLLGEINIVMS